MSQESYRWHRSCPNESCLFLKLPPLSRAPGRLHPIATKLPGALVGRVQREAMGRRTRLPASLSENTLST